AWYSGAGRRPGWGSSSAARQKGTPAYDTCVVRERHGLIVLKFLRASEPDRLLDGARRDHSVLVVEPTSRPSPTVIRRVEQAAGSALAPDEMASRHPGRWARWNAHGIGRDEAPGSSMYALQPANTRRPARGTFHPSVGPSQLPAARRSGPMRSPVVR